MDYIIFCALRKIYQLENEKLLIFNYSLNGRALYPTILECQNIKVALKIFKDFIIQALNQSDSNIEHSEITTHFIHIVATWWKIVKVNLSKRKRFTLNVTIKLVVSVIFPLEND